MLDVDESSGVVHLDDPVATGAGQRDQPRSREPLRQLPSARFDEGAAPLQQLTNGSFVVQRGLLVAPRRGRLLLFSGGGENFHSALPAVQGRRQSLQAFFKCAPACAQQRQSTARTKDEL